MAEPHEHLEHAEHHVGDPLNQKVALSMAIVAACLAGIGMLGHRSHNLVLQLQGDSNRLRTEAATAEVQMSNLFAWYQAKKLRQAQYDVSSSVVELIPGVDADKQEKQKKLSKDWKEKAKGYDQHNEKKDNLPDLEERGAEAGERAQRLTDKARELRLEADHVHHQADRLDVAHVLAEVALVLCSITLLTKKRLFWYTGMAASVVAIGLTISAYLIPPETHPPHEPTMLAH